MVRFLFGFSCFFDFCAKRNFIAGRAVFILTNGNNSNPIPPHAPKTPNGNYMINPSGIRGRVSEIVKQMEMDLIKQRATTQHE